MDDVRVFLAGFVVAALGAGFAFALESTDESLWIFELQPLGAVLLAIGVLAMGAVLIARMGGGGRGGGAPADHKTVKALSGLIAVVAGVTAVAALAIVTLSQLSDESDSVVAVTTSAFGVISAVVGAYMGIKMGTETAEQLGEKADETVIAQHEVAAKDGALAEMNAVVKDLEPGDSTRQALEQAKVEGEQRVRAARAPNPPPGVE